MIIVFILMMLCKFTYFTCTLQTPASHVMYYFSFPEVFYFGQERMWMANPDQFVEDEDDDTFSYSVRISAQDLLLVRRTLLICSACFAVVAKLPSDGCTAKTTHYYLHSSGSFCGRLQLLSSVVRSSLMLDSMLIPCVISLKS